MSKFGYRHKFIVEEEVPEEIIDTPIRDVGTFHPGYDYDKEGVDWDNVLRWTQIVLSIVVPTLTILYICLR